jgi:phosphoglycolate phosphatase
MDNNLTGILRAVIFDCDGVIIDSREDIAHAVNEALAHFGMKTVSENQLVSFTGNGAQSLIARAAHYSLQLSGVQSADVDTVVRIPEILSWYLDYYEVHAVVKTHLYPGIAELLESLYSHRISIGMVTNKPVRIAAKILSFFAIDSYFSVITGPEHVHHIKPDPEGISITIAEMNRRGFACSNLSGRMVSALRPEQVLMVGDSAVDIAAGRAGGCHTCAIMNGFGDHEKLAAAQPDFTLRYAGDLRAVLAL